MIFPLSSIPPTCAELETEAVTIIIIISHLDTDIPITYNGLGQESTYVCCPSSYKSI
jgi:hypothetical protein